jgi:hypothetical protein
MLPNDVRSVLRKSRRIEGWFQPAAAGLFGLIDEVQRAHDIRGDLFEIGAHHGKSAVLLANMARPTEVVGVCDVFAGQEANISGSGSGDRAVFDRNLQSVAPKAAVNVYQKLSTALSPSEIGGPYRLFHVDGGHLAEEALSDLELGAAVLNPRGVIVVDDPFAFEWPGVTEAIIAFCAAHPEFEPVALGFNKLMLVRTEARALYDTALADSVWAYIDRKLYVRKTLPICGSAASIFLTPSDRQMRSIQPSLVRVGWLIAGVRRRLKSRQ